LKAVKRLLPLLLATLAVAAAALAANLFVLDRAGASGDEVGNLRPVQPALTAPAVSPPAPSPLPTTTAHDGDHHDGEHHGRDHSGDDD
jgi:hypothetical protein